MCNNAASTVGSLMAAVEPDLVNLLTLLGIADTPDGQAAINAYNAALQAVENWKQGTSAQTVIQLIGAFTQVFNTLPIPTEAKGLEAAISAAIVVIVGILTGNSPAPAPAAGTLVTASKEEIQHAHQSAVAKDTEEKVQVLVPGFKRSLFHSVTHQYEGVWKKAVDAAAATDPKYAVLKAA